MENFLTFQEFMTEEEGLPIVNILEEHGIPTTLDRPRDLLDTVLIGKQYNNYFQLRIPAGCFEQAQQLLLEHTRIDLDKIDKNYILFSFSDAELTDVISHPLEWGAFNYNLAHHLLTLRNVPVNRQAVSIKQETELQQTATQRTINATWLFFGYGFSILTVLAIATNNVRVLMAMYLFKMLPGLLGIILGAVILSTKKTLPDGSQMTGFDDQARMHGRLMIALSVLASALVLYKLGGYQLHTRL